MFVAPGVGGYTSITIANKGSTFGYSPSGLVSSYNIVNTVYNGGTTSSSSSYASSFDGASQTISTSGAVGYSDSEIAAIGDRSAQLNIPFKGDINDIIVYSTALSANAQALINQYESAKWGVALTGPGNATGESGLTGTEAQQAMASTQAGATTDGYSVFADTYLERLSQTSNIILEASGNVTLNLQGDNMALSAGKSISITSTGGNIDFISPGTITTNNAAITLTPGSGDSIILNSSSAVTLASQGGASTWPGRSA